ncbi:amidohydrolase family protein [Thermodesulfobacteriota bacterium]
MIIDSHVHVFPDEMREDRSSFFNGEPAFESIYNSSKAKLVGVEELILNMDREGIDKAVIFGFPWENEKNYKRHNDYIIEAVLHHPTRLIGFCCFSPLSPGGAREAERGLESGLSGVGELAVYDSGFSSDTIELLSEVMSLCAGSDAPFLLHTNEPVGHKYPGKSPMDLALIYKFLKAYPSNRIVLAHWGGGLLFYALMKREVKDVLHNVWFDTAASPFLYSPDIYNVAGEIIGFEKILFGSDYPLISPERYFLEMEQAGISSEHLKKIKGDNAAGFFKRI